MDINKAKRAMEATINLLQNVSIPIKQFETVGKPILGAINNILIGLNALKEEPEIDVKVNEEDLKDA